MIRHWILEMDLITEVDNFDEFKEVLKTKGGFISAHWDGTSETEEKIKESYKSDY